MRKNKAKEIIKNGNAVINGWLQIPSTVSAETMAIVSAETVLGICNQPFITALPFLIISLALFFLIYSGFETHMGILYIKVIFYSHRSTFTTITGLFYSTEWSFSNCNCSCIYCYTTGFHHL